MVHCKVNLNPPVIYYYTFQGGAFDVVPLCLIFVLLWFWFLFIMYVSLLSYFWIRGWSGRAKVLSKL